MESTDKTLHVCGVPREPNTLYWHERIVRCGDFRMSSAVRLLLIDDDRGLCELLIEYLRSTGFEVEAAHDPDEGLRRALSGNYAMIVLDVMLPGIDGFEVLRRLRERSQVPVLMLTARGEDVDRIVGLE